MNGGYDFPGSNSGIDLYALTGWLPESISFRNKGKGGKGGESDDDDASSSSSSSTKSNEKGKEAHGDKVWRKMESAHRHGDCLITMATGDELSEAEGERAGLVPGHAYAVLQVREVSLVQAGLPTSAPGAALSSSSSSSSSSSAASAADGGSSRNGVTSGGGGVVSNIGGGSSRSGGGVVRSMGVVRLLLVKNPWAKKRWRGNYSEIDERHWTPQLRQLLGYDPDTAKVID